MTHTERTKTQRERAEREGKKYPKRATHNWCVTPTQSEPKTHKREREGERSTPREQKQNSGEGERAKSIFLLAATTPQLPHQTIKKTYLGHTSRAHLVQEGSGLRPPDSKLAEGRQVNHADIVSGLSALLGHRIKPVRAAETGTIFFFILLIC